MRKKEEEIRMNKGKRREEKRGTNINNQKSTQTAHGVSGGQIQEGAEKIMDEQTRWYLSLGNGIGITKIKPIQINMKKNACFTV